MIVAVRALSVIHVMTTQQKIDDFFSQRQQEQPINNCGELMAVCGVSSSVLEDSSVDSAENSMARSNEDSTSVYCKRAFNEIVHVYSVCVCVEAVLGVVHELEFLLISMANGNAKV